MTTIRISWLGALALAAGLLGWVTNWWMSRNGFPTPVLHLSSLFTLAAIVVVTLVLGMRVNRWRNGERKRMLDPLLATRTLVLSQATAYAGALILGWHLGILLDQVALVSVRSTLVPVWSSVALIAGGIVMIVVGVLVEGFCRLPPDDDGGGQEANEGEYA